MTRPLDELYLEWLYSKVASVRYRSPQKTYWNLFKHLYSKEFIWIILGDDNRAQDGLDLRYRFAEEQDLDEPEWMGLGCSMLEMLIALAERYSFETGESSTDAFWHFLRSLRLDVYNDSKDYPFNRVEDILDKVIWRTYSPNGRGGIFPLRDAKEDQRKIELWYQLSAAVLEQM